MKKVLISIAPHLVAIIIFISIAVAYFSPLLDNYELAQSDIANFKGASKEISDYRILHGDEPLWTNSMFSGMPAYQISVIHHGNWIRSIEPWLRFNLPNPMAVLFMTMFGFYIFCLCVGVNPWLGIAGSIAFGLSTVNILYLGAGHATKVNAIAYMAPVLGGLILAFRRKVLLGVAVFTFFLALQISANHLQMTYYLAWLLAAVGIGELVRLLLKKEMKQAFVASACLLLGAILAAMPNWSSLLTTYEYGEYTTRGKSELTVSPTGESKSSSESAGLETGYILEYNFGKEEAWQLLIPNAKGGETGAIGEDKALMRKVKAPEQIKDYVGKSNRYWGEQKYTGGAFYFGAFMIFFFLLALIFFKDSLRWPFLVVGLLALSLCTNDPTGLNAKFIESFPMYGKFRDSKMILVLLMIMIPALAIMFIDNLIKQKLELASKTKMIIAAVGLGFVVFIGILIASPDSFFQFIAPQETASFDEALSAGQADKNTIFTLIESLESVRMEIFKSDAQRSLLLFILASGILAMLLFMKKSRIVAIPIIAVIVFADMWTVDRRYLNSDKEKGKYISYVEQGEKAFPFKPSAADVSILQRESASIQSSLDSLSTILEKGMAEQTEFKKLKSKKDLEWLADFGALNMLSNYRVLTIGGPMADASVSYFHKSIGGYHGAKLKKYQELYDYKMNTEIQNLYDSLRAGAHMNALATSDVLNMLNTKYIIVNPDGEALENPFTYGPAWFVKNVKKVNTADDAIQALKTENLKETAIIREGDLTNLTTETTADSLSSVVCTGYDVNRVTYRTNASKEGLLVFSEVNYREGWKCIINGNETPYGEVNYVLRGVKCPAGESTIEWVFDPPTFRSSTNVSMAGSALLILLIAGTIFKEWRDRKKEGPELKSS
jgi:Bacterial membrane protein YfhO